MPRDDAPPAPAVGDPADRTRLVAGWTATFGSPPPPRLSVAFLARALAHERQCRAQGGLSPATRRALAAALAGSRGAGTGKAGKATATTIVAPGAQLVREWNGRTYRVEVLEAGYRFDGRTWPALTAIARLITGTNWSGPRFFGLTPRRGGG